ncbi:tetratricopeptide repeat protein [Microbacterium sp. USHLN272]|uniref:tetratricopeptide repeat protein n=1 Tax=Microbacterium sp. USHLN272 TaxID=3081287 RepID=UPI003015AE9B
MTDPLGMVETIEADSSSSWDAIRPVLPGMSIRSSGARPRRAPLASSRDRLSDLILAQVEDSVLTARRQADAAATSTSIAALAHALETAGQNSEAVEKAKDALARCQQLEATQRSDPFAARLAIEVLLRSGKLDDVLGYARVLPISAHLKLEIGAVLAGRARFDEACSLIGDSTVPEREAIEGYVLALKGEFQRAAPHLRAALRHNPHDADSALNLSISLLGLGARQKARKAAEQAREAAPARADIWLHLLELILTDGELARAEREIDLLLRRGVEPTARLMVVQARVALGKGNLDLALRMLERASAKASEDGDADTVAEVRSNLYRIRAGNGMVPREQALDDLKRLMAEFPDSDVTVVNFAQVAWLRHHAATLSSAFHRVKDQLSPANSAFVLYQLASLNGDNETAAVHATSWSALEPRNDHAFAALMIALGIGEERWDEAAQLAEKVVARDGLDSTSLNNAAYVLAMAGQAERALRILEPRAEESFILKATLGLAHLAAGRIESGMRLYRQAADEAEARKDDARSLMTAYQALIVRQLGLLDNGDEQMIAALSLPPYPLPDDWEDRPEFLRLYEVARRHGFDWPLAI